MDLQLNIVKCEIICTENDVVLRTPKKVTVSHSGATTGGSGGSRLRAPARRGRLAASI